MNNYVPLFEDFSNSMNRHKAMPLPEDITRMSILFKTAGKDLYVVGGAVRDFIMNKTPHDFDLVTNALPEESKKILAGWNVSDEQGKAFGVLRVYTDSEPLGYELATYRKDISKGRDNKGVDAKVEIGNHLTIEDDVKRRDLTINSLFYDIDKGQVVDLTNGISDINNNIVRFVGAPDERINEDRLRILRAFRFAARSNGEFDKETATALKKDHRLRNVGLLDDVKQERIFEEFNKMFKHAATASDGAAMLQHYIDLLTEYDMWPEIFPGIKIKTDVNIFSVIPAVVFADIIDEDMSKRERYFIDELRFTVDLCHEIEFLQVFGRAIMDPNNAYTLATVFKQYNMSDDLILEYSYGKNLDKNVISAFLKYCKDGFVVDGNELAREGYKGEQIGIEKRRLENERYLKNYLKK